MTWQAGRCLFVPSGSCGDAVAFGVLKVRISTVIIRWGVAEQAGVAPARSQAVTAASRNSSARVSSYGSIRTAVIASRVDMADPTAAGDGQGCKAAGDACRRHPTHPFFFAS